MRNPPILRAVVTDIHGDTLYDSADQPRRRIVSCKPLIVKRYEPPQSIAGDPSSTGMQVLIAVVAITLVIAAVIVAAVVSA